MKGGPSEPPYRRRLQTTLRCCFLREVVVNGEGKGPESNWRNAQQLVGRTPLPPQGLSSKTKCRTKAFKLSVEMHEDGDSPQARLHFATRKNRWLHLVHVKTTKSGISRTYEECRRKLGHSLLIRKINRRTLPCRRYCSLFFVFHLWLESTNCR
jgi:hypothetical protein